ncbi:MAG: hypothetical protein ABSA83_10495 [Verrucomicrobiota bacterium]|jgi:hypothetical protein
MDTTTAARIETVWKATGNLDTAPTATRSREGRVFPGSTSTSAPAIPFRHPFQGR